MICQRCATGADLISQMHKDEGTGYFTGINDFRARDFISVARALHKICEDHGGCDCQHHVRELLKTANNSGESISRGVPELQLNGDTPQAAITTPVMGITTDPLY